MPTAVLVMDPATILGRQHPDVTRDLSTGRILSETITTPFFVYTAVMTRNNDALQTLARVDIAVQDTP